MDDWWIKMLTQTWDEGINEEVAQQVFDQLYKIFCLNVYD